jgi:hypothetical protein
VWVYIYTCVCVCVCVCAVCVGFVVGVTEILLDRYCGCQTTRNDKQDYIETDDQSWAKTKPRREENTQQSKRTQAQCTYSIQSFISWSFLATIK